MPPRDAIQPRIIELTVAYIGIEPPTNPNCRHYFGERLTAKAASESELKSLTFANPHTRESAMRSPHPDVREEFLKMLLAAFGEIEAAHKVSIAALLETSRSSWGNKRLRERALNSKLPLEKRNISHATYHQGILPFILKGRLPDSRIELITSYFDNIYLVATGAVDGRSSRLHARKQKKSTAFNSELFDKLRGQISIRQLQNDSGLIVDLAQRSICERLEQNRPREAIENALLLRDIIEHRRADLRLEDQNKYSALMMTILLKGGMACGEAGDLDSFSRIYRKSCEVLKNTPTSKEHRGTRARRVTLMRYPPVIWGQHTLLTAEFARLEATTKLGLVDDGGGWLCAPPGARITNVVQTADMAVDMCANLAEATAYFGGQGLEASAVLARARAIDLYRTNHPQGFEIGGYVWRHAPHLRTLESYINAKINAPDSNCLRSQLPSLLIARARDDLIPISNATHPWVLEGKNIGRAVTNLELAWTLNGRAMTTSHLAYCDWYIAVARTMGEVAGGFQQAVAFDRVATLFRALGGVNRALEFDQQRIHAMKDGVRSNSNNSNCDINSLLSFLSQSPPTLSP